jgi:hypothetical protein
MRLAAGISLGGIALSIERVEVLVGHLLGGDPGANPARARAVMGEPPCWLLACRAAEEAGAVPARAGNGASATPLERHVSLMANVSGGSGVKFAGPGVPIPGRRRDAYSSRLSSVRVWWPDCRSPSSLGASVTATSLSLQKRARNPISPCCQSNSQSQTHIGRADCSHKIK